MLENIKYKESLVFFLILLIYVVFALPYSPLYCGLGYDKEVFQYVGMLIDLGQVPYIDVFDHKPPLIFVLNYLGFVITPNSTWGIFIILNTIGFLSSLLVYKLANKQTKNVLLSVLITILYICLINSSAFLQGGNYTRQFTAYLTICIMYWVFGRQKSKCTPIILGVLIGLIFFTQQNEILGGLILVCYYLVFKQDFKLYSFKEIITNGVVFLLGLGVLFLATLALIYSWGNYNEFINQAYLYNLDNYIQQKSIFHKIFKIIYAFGGRVVRHIPLIVIVLVLIYHVLFSVLKKKKFAIPFIIILVGFVFQIISTSISGRAFGHYFLMFIPYLIVMFMYTLKTVNINYLRYISGIIFLSITFHYLQDVSYDKNENKMLAEILEKVEYVKGSKGQFYSFDATFLRVNFNLNISSPSKWVYPHYMGQEMLKEIQNSLQTNKTKFVLIGSSYLEELPNLKLFFFQNYTQTISDDKHILFERK